MTSLDFTWATIVFTNYVVSLKLEELSEYHSFKVDQKTSLCRKPHWLHGQHMVWPFQNFNRTSLSNDSKSSD